MKENFWRNLIETSLNTEEDELDCLECFEILDQYVDLLDAGQEPSKVLPKLEHHLSVCHCCHAELNGILIALKAAADPATDSQ